MRQASAAIVVLAAALSAGADEGQFRRLSLADYRDKMAGAWLGQSAGVAYGWPTEFKHCGKIIPEENLPVWKPELINGTFSQDDLYVEMTFLETLEKYGIDVDVRQAGIEFANSRYRLWCANNNARNNIRNGIAAPWSSDPKYHPSTDDIDYQIEADFAGIISPGMPARVRRLAGQFGRIMNYGDGLYAGIFVGSLYAEAFFSSNRVAIVQTALESIPAESKYAEMVRDMLRWYGETPQDWKAAWRKAVDKWQAKENIGRVSFAEIDVKINGAMVLLGYLWGEGDPDRTMRISTAGGYDSDCNPSSACGVLFTSLGASAVPARFKDGLSKTNTWEYTAYDYPRLLATCERLTRKLVIAEGGRIEGEDLLIRNDGPHLSKDEMKSIRYAAAKSGEQSLACATAALAAALSAGERPDPRTRTFVEPVRAWGSVDASSLTAPKFGQVAEGEFLVGSGPVLKRGEWVVLDFGRELHGGVQIGSGAKSGKNALAHVRFGESVSEAMSELGERGACNDHAIRDDVVRLPWYGRREIGETGFRFVRIDNAGDDPLQLDYVRAVSVMRPMKRLGGFKSSDPRLNRVFETAVRTVHLCCQDYLWDGIKRDRLVWMGDTHPETMAILAVFGAADVLPDSLDYMAATTPADKWMDTMPTYTLWWIRNLAEWYRFTGDKAYLEKHADYLEKTFAHVRAGMDAHGRWTSGNFLDWPTQHNDEAATAGTQGLALITARETAFLAKALGRSALAEKAEAMAQKLAAQKPDPHGAKSAAALLALSGLRTPREMFDGVIGMDGHAGVSTFYGYYMLEAMSAANEGQRALNTVRDYWGGMLDMGATSFWEDFNLAWTNGAFRIDEPRVAGKKDIHGDYGDFCYAGFRHSLCHGWAAGPAAWCINHVLGIRPLDVGCRTVEVKPFLGDLAWAEGAMALPDGGCVKVRAEKRPDGSVSVSVDAPDRVRIQTD